MSVLGMLGAVAMLAGMVAFVGPATRVALTGAVGWVTSEKVLVAASIALMLSGALCLARP
ncbi:MAG: hypothetical protein PGN15_09915 [Aeromicrobium erythreum]